VPYHDW